MTVPSATFQTFQAIGIREDLSDIIYNISPTDTPFINNAKRGKVSSALFEWQTDALATAVSTNHLVEGDDITNTTITPTVRLKNYCQISGKNVRISGTEQAVRKAGRSDEMQYQAALKAKELRRDMEFDLLSNHGASAGSASTARVTGAMQAFLKTNISKTGTDPVYTDTPTDVRTFGSTRSLTETLVKTVLQLQWAQGGSPTTLLCGGLRKQDISGFSGIVELTSIQKANPATIIGAADAYVSDFGTLAVVPDRFCASTDVWSLDFDYIEIDYLRTFFMENLAKTGDSDNRAWWVEYGLRVGNEKAEGLVTDLA